MKASAAAADNADARKVRDMCCTLRSGCRLAGSAVVYRRREDAVKETGEASPNRAPLLSVWADRSVSWPVGSNQMDLQDQIDDERRPPGLVGGAEPRSAVAVEVLVEEHEIAPVRIVLEE